MTPAELLLLDEIERRPREQAHSLVEAYEMFDWQIEIPELIEDADG